MKNGWLNHGSSKMAFLKRGSSKMPFLKRGSPKMPFLCNKVRLKWHRAHFKITYA